MLAVILAEDATPDRTSMVLVADSESEAVVDSCRLFEL